MLEKFRVISIKKEENCTENWYKICSLNNKLGYYDL